MPDVFEALGAAHREVEQMLDRMLYLIGGQAEPTAELLEQGGSLAAALISAVSRHEAARGGIFLADGQGESRPMGNHSQPGAPGRKPKSGRCSPN